jgi:hypothetical protein
MAEKDIYVHSLELLGFPGDWGMFWGIGQQSLVFSGRIAADCLQLATAYS